MSDYEDNIDANHLEEHFDESLADIGEDNLSDLLSSSPPPSSPPSTGDSINKLTLELLLNANNYKKYVSKYGSTDKKDAKYSLADLDLYLGNIEEFIESSLEKAVRTGSLEWKSSPIDSMYDMHEAFRVFLEKSVEYYKNLANIKVKKIDPQGDKNFDKMNTLEKEQVTFLKVKKSSLENKSEKNSRHGSFDMSTEMEEDTYYPSFGEDSQNSSEWPLKIETSKLSPAGTFFVPPPPVLRRYQHNLHHWP